MSWIGRKIYEYLKECEEFNKDLLGSYVSKKDNLGEPPRSEGYANKKIIEYFEKTPKEKVLEDWNACQLHILFSGKSFAGLDKRKVGEEMSNAKGCVPKTDNIPPAPKRNAVEFSNDPAKFVWFDEKGIKHNFDLNKELVDLGIAPPPAPERVPFENFKNNRKKMKKEVRHCERFILTSVKEDGKVSITIEPKKGFDVCNVSLNVVTGELPKEHVLPKELLNPRTELQDQYDTLAKLIATRDYYNAGSVFSNSDIVAVIIVDCVSQDIVGHGGDVRFGKTKSKLYFKNALTADIFLKNFRTEIESVKHLI